MADVLTYCYCLNFMEKLLLEKMSLYPPEKLKRLFIKQKTSFEINFKKLWREQYVYVGKHFLFDAK